MPQKTPNSCHLEHSERSNIIDPSVISLPQDDIVLCLSHNMRIRYAIASPIPIVARLKTRLNAIPARIWLLANGLRPNASTPLPATLPKNQSPRTRLIITTIAASIYLNEEAGERNGDLNATSRF